LIPCDDDADDLLVLTAAHVLDQVTDGARVLWAPRGLEPSSTDGSYCGTVRRRVPLVNLPAISVDAAVIKPPPHFACRNHLACGAPTGIRDLWVVEDESRPIAVRKHGAQTQLTSGELLPVAADLRIEGVKTQYRDGWWVYGSDGTAFATRGDSGAIVVDEERSVVGMVVAVENPGPDAATFIHGVRQIFKALQIQMP